jgi:hypothetical protein
MARIPTVDLEEARGVRKLLVWVNECRYGGVVPGIYRILARDLSDGGHRRPDDPPDAERFMAERAGAHTIVEVEASHSIAVSQPAAVADLIRSAVRTSA